MELVVIVFIVAMLSLNISTLIYNMMINNHYTETLIKVDNILWEDASRARAGVKSKEYENISISRTYEASNGFLGIKNLSIQYITITVFDNNTKVEKTTIVVRGVD